MSLQLLSTMSQNITWLFDGIGTEIICIVVSLLLGGLGGGAIGYKIGVKNKTKQKQTARDNANQTQIGSVGTLAL